MKAKHVLRVDMDRLTAICTFVAGCRETGVIDDKTMTRLIREIERTKARYIDKTAGTVYHDHTGCPTLDDWLARRRGS